MAMFAVPFFDFWRSSRSSSSPPSTSSRESLSEGSTCTRDWCRRNRCSTPRWRVALGMSPLPSARGSRVGKAAERLAPGRPWAIPRSRRACRSRRFAIHMPGLPPSAWTRCTTKSSSWTSSSSTSTSTTASPSRRRRRQQTTPKRFIGGGKTLSRYNSDGYVDTKTGDIYIVNNDSEPGLFRFPRTAEGNVEPANELTTPYGAFGMTVDEERGEIFVTIQHDGAVQVYPKAAKADENAIRLIQGNRTGLADPHGVAFDPKTRLHLRRQLRHRARRDIRRRSADAESAERAQPAGRQQRETAQLARWKPEQCQPPRGGLRQRQVRSALDHRARRGCHRQRRAGPAHRRPEERS